MKHPLPVDDAHLPRAQRRHPFRPANDGELPEVLVDAEAVLGGARVMIASICRDVLPPWRHSMDLADLEQEVVVRLLYYALPRFDARRGAKLTTYLHTCARWAAMEQVRRLLRRKHNPAVATLDDPDDQTAPDRSADAAVERMADKILADPRAYLTPALAAAVAGADRTLTITEQAHSVGLTARNLVVAKCKAAAQIRRLADDLEIP